jgi:hypothetical protein
MMKRGFIAQALILLILLLMMYWIIPMLLGQISLVNFSQFQFDTGPVSFILYAMPFVLLFIVLGGGLLAVWTSLKGGG